MFVFSFKQRLNDCLTENWTDHLSSSSRCDTHCTFKSLLNIEHIFIYLSTFLFILENILLDFDAQVTNLILN